MFNRKLRKAVEAQTRAIQPQAPVLTKVEKGMCAGSGQPSVTEREQGKGTCSVCGQVKRTQKKGNVVLIHNTPKGA